MRPGWRRRWRDTSGTRCRSSATATRSPFAWRWETWPSPCRTIACCCEPRPTTPRTSCASSRWPRITCVASLAPVTWPSTGPRAVSDEGTESLEKAVRNWVAAYRNAEHLYRTLDWVVALEPEASQALRLAALTHDIERHFPGGPRADPRRVDWDDADYLRAHSERSASFVAQWLANRGTDEALVSSTVELVRAHELGRSRDADVLQGADSLSFLEV